MGGRRSSVVVAWLLCATTTVTVPAVAHDSPPAATEARVGRVAGGDRIATAVALSRAAFGRAPAAVLARADAFADALAGAPLAADLGGPILLTPQDRLPDVVRGELDRLGVTEVVLLGGPEAIGRDVEEQVARSYAVRRVAGPDRAATAVAIAEEVGTPPTVYLTAQDRFADALAIAPLAAHTRRPVLLSARDRLPAVTSDWLRRQRPSGIVVVGGPAAVSETVVAALRDDGFAVRRLAGRDRYETAAAISDEGLDSGLRTTEVWLATGTTFPDALAAGPAVAARRATLLLVPGRDLRRAHAPIDRLRAQRIESIRIIGGPSAVTSAAGWQVPVIRHAPWLPRGGLTLFPAFRMVAFYGNGEVPAMGVLGEQPPDEAYERLWRQARPYAAGGRPVLPTFELIVSIATRSAGPDGDYSRPTDPAIIQRWLDAARRHDTYLLLDIQTGRTDFLTEARRYERFLRQPDVGLALDPEWRMDDDEVPGETIGSVDAAEVNTVVDWLAAIVREERLPQKLLVVHQFRTDMVTNRDRIRTPAELALVFHMDGHGSRSQKLETYRHVRVDPARRGAWNGFKLFYDEDRDLFSPRELLDTVRPVPDLVTYQ